MRRAKMSAFVLSGLLLLRLAAAALSAVLVDHRPDCVSWAATGECNVNQPFMLLACG